MGLGDAAGIGGIPFALYRLTLFAFAPVPGRLADRFGRRTCCFWPSVGW